MSNNWNVQDKAESFAKRESWTKIAEHEKHGKLVTGMNEANTKLETALKNVFAKPTAEAKALASVAGPVKRAQKKMAEVADLNKYDWVKKADVKDEAFEQAHTAYHEAGAKFENFLTGKEKVGNTEVSEALKKTFEEAQTATGKVKSLVNSPFGMAKVEGWRTAVENNVKSFKNIKDASKGAKTILGFRAVSAVGGCALMADSFRSTSKGEDRSASNRLVEFMVGAGAVGAAATMGHAR